MKEHDFHLPSTKQQEILQGSTVKVAKIKGWRSILDFQKAILNHLKSFPLCPTQIPCEVVPSHAGRFPVISFEISTTISATSKFGFGKIGLCLEEAAQLPFLLLLGGWVSTHLKNMQPSNWIICPRGEKNVKPPPSADCGCWYPVCYLEFLCGMAFHSWEILPGTDTTVVDVLI